MTHADRGGRLQRLAAELLVYGDVQRLTAAEVPPRRASRLSGSASCGERPASQTRPTTTGGSARPRSSSCERSSWPASCSVRPRRCSCCASSVRRSRGSLTRRCRRFITTIGAASVAADPTTTALAEANESAVALIPQMSEVMVDLLRQHLVDAARPNVTGPHRPGSRRSPRRWASSTSWDRRDSRCTCRWGTSAAPSGCSRSTRADVVAANNGRVVKFIGDEVMFRVA